MRGEIRLYVDQDLLAGQSVPLSRDQTRYVLSVMRLTVGATLLLFNGRHGEWRGELVDARKQGAILTVREQTRPLRQPPDLWLLFAPLKKARTDFVVEKAVEMGVSRICPVQTDFTNAERIRRDRMQAHAIEAAEQCGATLVPEVSDLARLGRLLDHWPQDRPLMFCDETLAGAPARLPDAKGPWAVLIGPEGGFSETERKRLRDMERACPVALGPRILRAETAAVAALTLWQSTLGDWGTP